MKWNVHSAIITGTEHERTKRNRQDFCGYFLPNNPGKDPGARQEQNPGLNRQSDQDRHFMQGRYGGVVCDGCSGGPFSEVGAALIGNLVLTLIKKKDITRPDVFGGYVEKNVSRFIRHMPSLSKALLIHEKVRFVYNFLLTTFIFAVIEGGRLIIGRSGDGVIIINDYVKIIDQQGKPQYIAYREVPKEFFTEPPRPAADFSIESYETDTIQRVVIASDGLIPLIREKRVNELYGSKKRQLQRRFNVWQQKEKLFYDDVSCVVFEKKEEDE